jgi:hypothetical protein
MHRLEGERLRWFSWDYRISRGGEPLTLLDLEVIRSRGAFELAGERYGFRRTGRFVGAYVLVHRGRVIARAERERLLPPVYRVYAGDRVLQLRQRLPGRRFQVLHGTRAVGQVRPRSLFSRSFVAEFGEELPLPVEVFILAVVLIRWRHRARASS